MALAIVRHPRRYGVAPRSAVVGQSLPIVTDARLALTIAFSAHASVTRPVEVSTAIPGRTISVHTIRHGNYAVIDSAAGASRNGEIALLRTGRADFAHHYLRHGQSRWNQGVDHVRPY